MGRRLLYIGRILFVVLLLVQCIVLVKYTVKYEGNNNAYWFAAPYGVVLIVWATVFCCGSLVPIDQLWLVWLVYSIALVVMVGRIFGRTVIEGKLDNDSFYGPNVLTTTLCIAPAEMLLLLNSATDKPGFQSVLAELSFTATLDLFDGIEMLEVILEEDGNPHATSMGMKKTILGFVCVFFLISCLELLQIKFKEYTDQTKVRKRVFCIHILFQFFLNTSFLVLRIILWAHNGRDAAIFLAKNVISLVLILVRVLLRFGCI